MSMTDYRHIPLRHDFAFSEVMREPDICQCFLETVLGIRIRKLEFISKQEDLTDSLLGHGIRLDIYVEDDAGSVYNIEMQNRLETMKRIRYYQGGIDRRTLGRSRNYEDLKTSFIIVVCSYDPAGLHYPLYARESRLACPVGTAEYDDGSHVVLLNSRYDPEYRPEMPAVCEFLDLLNQTGDLSPQTMQYPLAQMAAESLTRLRKNEKKEAVFMTLSELIEREAKDRYEEGREEGRAEGREEGRIKGRKEGQQEEREANIKKLMTSLNLSREEAEKLLK